jgi:hypothetical protein
MEFNFGDTVAIYNLNGQLLISKELNDDSAEINISSLTSGMYLIKIKTDSGTKTKKFIKE